MSDIELSQSDADRLIRMPKRCAKKEIYEIPQAGEISVPIIGIETGENFSLDIEKGGRIVISRYKLQERARISFPLVRLDFGNCRPHTNPDGEVFNGPHLHIYKEGFGDRWAQAVPGAFKNINDFWDVYDDFMGYCNIVTPPEFAKGLFP